MKSYKGSSGELFIRFQLCRESVFLKSKMLKLLLYQGKFVLGTVEGDQQVILVESVKDVRMNEGRPEEGCEVILLVASQVKNIGV